MDTQSFEAQLKASGYTEIETKVYEPKPANGEHGHHFAVQGLVLDGEFIVIQNGQRVSFAPGHIFTVPAGDLHCEEIGPDGAKVLLGRKY
jgi:quercetin dioxygenase-like cupin family protein